MNFYVIKLQFTSPLHLSMGSEDYSESNDILHSDTLKSALFVSYYQLFNDTSPAFFDNFQISSAFPFYKDLYFFPKPFTKLSLRLSTEEDPIHTKKLKKIQWIDKNLFEHTINGESISISENNFSKNGKLVSVEFSEKDSSHIYVKDEQERVKINYDEDNAPFTLERIYFHSDAGLYVLVDCSEEFLQQKLLPAFKLLGDTGVGSYKTIGNGQFIPRLENNKMTLRAPSQNQHWMNLSLYCPTQEEVEKKLEFEKSSYQFVKRGGYLTYSTHTKGVMRKKSVYMFQEGSVFQADALEGKLADLKPENFAHAVYREGRPIFIPVKPLDI